MVGGVGGRALRMAGVLVAVSALLVLPAPVRGQAVPGHLYMTDKNLAPAGACDGTPTFAMSDAMPAAGKAYTGTSGGGFACAFSFTYTAAEDSVLTGDYSLALRVGCDFAGAAIELDYTLTVAGDTAATARPGVSWQCAAGEFDYLQTFSVDDVAVSAGDTIGLTLSLFAAAQQTPADNWYIATGVADTPSLLTGVGLPGTVLPDLGVGALVAKAIEGAVAHGNSTFTTVTSADELYTWPTTLTAATVAVAANVTTGSATVKVVDGANATALNETLDASGAKTYDLAVVAPGNWSIIVSYDNFTGDLAFTIDGLAVHHDAAGNATAPGTTKHAALTTTGSTSKTNATGASYFPLRYQDRDAPAGSFAVGSLVVALLALAVRRRAA